MIENKDNKKYEFYPKDKLTFKLGTKMPQKFLDKNVCLDKNTYVKTEKKAGCDNERNVG